VHISGLRRRGRPPRSRDAGRTHARTHAMYTDVAQPPIAATPMSAAPKAHGRLFHSCSPGRVQATNMPKLCGDTAVAVRSHARNPLPHSVACQLSLDRISPEHQQHLVVPMQVYTSIYEDWVNPNPILRYIVRSRTDTGRAPPDLHIGYASRVLSPHGTQR